MAPWEKFFEEKVKKMIAEHDSFLDIGGGLRISKQKSNRQEKKRLWIGDLLKNKEYKIMDPVNTYAPDIVGDIHRMPFAEGALEAVFCLSVLEHVENPHKAASELYRVLKQGGVCFLYVPFLYYFHAEKGYYKDYWRFTEDSLRELFKNFRTFEIKSVRGAVETWIHLSPLGKAPLFPLLARLLDWVSGKSRSKQVSGYYVFLIK